MIQPDSTMIAPYVFLQMSSRKTATRRGTTKKRAQRATSNVFAMFNQDQIAEFKEAFNMVNTENIIAHQVTVLGHVKYYTLYYLTGRPYPLFRTSSELIIFQIDQNRDGFIDKEDLHDMLASLGKDPTDDYLEAMMNEAPGPINFTMFLTLFGERLQVGLISTFEDIWLDG